MDAIVSAYLSQLRIGDPRTHENMTVFPLFHENAAGPEYVTLEEAIEKKWVTVEEVSESGVVPDLRVTNESPFAVLLLDGEEVAGAKQNRLINTTVFVRRESTVIIPVSCSEQGRWSYLTRAFTHSGYFSSYTIRSRKMKYVHENLKKREGYSSDQLRIWTDVALAHALGGTYSDTDAMRDMYEQKAGALDEFMSAFECVPGQRGCAVALGGKVLAVETVSSEEAFRRNFGKIVKSFAVEARWGAHEEAETPDREAVESFVREIVNSRETRFESVGEGYDYRYEGEDVLGSVLVVEGSVVHTSVFRLSRPGDKRHRRDSGESDGTLFRSLVKKLRREACR